MTNGNAIWSNGGAFYDNPTGSSSDASFGSGGTAKSFDGVGVNASLVSNVYAESDTVQPSAAQTLIIIKV